MRIFGKDKERDPPETETTGEIELEKLRQSIRLAALPAKVEEVALAELANLSRGNPAAAEYPIGLNYLNYLVSLPWHQTTPDNLDLQRAEQILNREHFGLTEIKERILEHLAVRILKSASRPKVLVVDDEKIARRNLEHVLSQENYLVKVAADGQEALRRLAAEPFDVVVTDYKMEKVDGLAVLEGVKALNPATIVIMVSGHATLPTAVQAMRQGTYHVLAKPLKLEELRLTVREALAGRSSWLENQGPILCLAGPPGTGKTSLQRSIALSLERRFVRLSLAGIKDEAEIRGHRRSYVGALPGRIIEEIRRGGSRNPVFMLDEIDKLSGECKGDPAAALLEVLDPQQNPQFTDHYLDVPFDLSKVMFVATANNVEAIPAPLLDRLEVLPLSGYLLEEKAEIARRHLIPRAIRETGLTEQPPTFTDPAIDKIISEHTREAGLRGLQRQLAAICRKSAREILRQRGADQPAELLITPERVETLLGPRKYFQETAGLRERLGVATGLAWTGLGGELIFVEATRMQGHNQLILTGSLGEVMKESAQAALSYLRSNTERYQIPVDFFENSDIHIHVPGGAIPKDGPSAGLTIAVALLSLLSKRPTRLDVALTGEITLTGRVLPVGGIKEKLLAARRAGIKTVLLPEKNRGHLRDLPAPLTKGLEIILVEEVSEVVRYLFG
ncbi:MAG: endopeptidase La [Desulfobulbaceae bacterium]|nr:endopeptidase La [Desulfobulbaceae bacterium]